MHPTISQALVSERVRDWRDEAARERSARLARLARRDTAHAGCGGAGPAAELARLADELAVMADERHGGAAARQAAGHRAA